jgi:hypothetical protein
MKNSLFSKGLSMSQAQSISNLCNQEARMLSEKLNGCNAINKSTRYNGDTLVMQRAKPLPTDVVSILQRKAKLHACQAFLMENIKAKENGLKELKNATFMHNVPALQYPQLKEANYVSKVDEDWGWSQLSIDEVNEYFQEEAYASHLGQFIHKDGPLDTLRKSLATFEEIEWLTKGTVTSAVTSQAHHTPEELLELHNSIAALHRKHEQRVNYFKAKIKNLVTEENTRRAEANANAEQDANSENNLTLTNYKNQLFLWESEKKKSSEEFEAKRASDIRELSALRISVDSRFQDIIDNFLSQIPE